MQSIRCAEVAGVLDPSLSCFQRYAITFHYVARIRALIPADANENSEAQVTALVKEFTTFHGCLTELGELMRQYGQPMPFPVKDFETTLKRCEKTLDTYADHLVDKKMGVKKFIFTIRYMGMEKEIEGLRKQITGHYQALHMCISFLQL